MLSLTRTRSRLINITKNKLRSLATQSEENVKFNAKQEQQRKNASNLRYIYPEFLPDPNIAFRNTLRERLEREDMLARRTLVDIPEFYVGTIMAVTISDRHNPGKPNRFVGICIQRGGCGLRAHFTLRNVIDHQGMEIMYEMYDPTVQKIEVLRLEKRLDDDLLYLRDALPEYSTFDPSMEAEILPEGTPVPVNHIKVKLKPRPWLARYERMNIKGIESIDVPERFWARAKQLENNYDKYDLMKEYMRTIPEEEQTEIFSEIQGELGKLELTRRKMKRKRTFVKPTKLA